MVTVFAQVRQRARRCIALPKGFGPIKVLVSCCTTIAVIVAASTGFIILSTYSNRLAEVRAQLEKVSSVLADHADRTFEALDLVERGVLADVPADYEVTPESFARLMSDVSVHQRLRDRIAGLPQVNTLALMDNNGMLVNFSRFWPPPKVSGADRDYFVQVSQPNGPDVSISRPVQSRVTGTWSIYFARRIESLKGEFLGVIVASIDLNYLETFFAGIADNPGDAISMQRADGVLLVRYPPSNDKIGQLATGRLGVVHQGRAREFNRFVSIWDGKDRFVATTRSVRYPLLLNVSVTVQSALARWKRQTWFLATAAALLEICLVLVANFGAKELRGRLRLSQERATRGRLVAEAELALARERETAAEERSARDRRFRIAIETMRQGLCMFDGDENLVVFNHRVATDLGIPVESLSPGLPLRSLIALLEEHGTIDAEGAARFRQSLSCSQAEPNTQTTTETLLDGRILSYAVRAMTQDKGWVLTCEDVTERHKAEQRLLHISLHDPLTDLANRTALRTCVEAEARRFRPHEGSALLYVDLDGFKEINDTLGHPAGDAVLQTVAKRLLKSTRSADTVARIGGDEFVIVQASSTDPGTATALAERLIEELRVPFDVSGHHLSLGASVGISFIRPGPVEPDLFIKNADLALYEAKKDGGNCYRIFKPELETAANAKSRLCAELRDAVANEEFVVHYQPLVSVPTRALCGFEALVRWQHPTRGLVPPGEFIGLAEEIGLIGQIGEQVLFQACAEAATWPKYIKIAVNLSPKQFGTHRRIAATVQEALNWSGLDPGRLELEITESILLQGNEETVNTLHNLKKLGAGISMDDFGTGYSSLSYLQKFPFDKLKIDQSFVHTMVDGGSGNPIIHAIIGLCKVIGLRTTAEGVETEMQFDLLCREGCDEAQGYLFGRPTAAHEIAGVIKRLSQTRNVKEAIFVG